MKETSQSFEIKYKEIINLVYENINILQNNTNKEINFKLEDACSIATIKDYESRIGYRFPETIRYLYQQANGLSITIDDVKFELYSIENIYKILKYKQKNDIYYHNRAIGYHIIIGKHSQGSLILNINKKYYKASDSEYKYDLYITNKNEQKWLGVNNIFDFLQTYTNSFFYPYWTNIDAVEYFDKDYEITNYLNNEEDDELEEDFAKGVVNDIFLK